ncbi:XRE family transcriptional regulator [Desulfovibrio psychrotolerans]|uniref:Cro/Cl family transcriptional regulator n=1 Tax=Desulfovibrio psychrotolerans TaxID=415242 RepID=A0A7J0BVK3_9BACT|nr:XRE family transcriptional regulator [Desulfovibrio psychrotolerans]GFM37698.1 Cro/Cl family transcriptional regulator [Desulfovibrio psychrotolerans]
MSFGDRIKILRGGETQAEFASRIGISQRALGNYERNERTPDVDFAALVCSKTGASAAWLLLGKEDSAASQNPQPTSSQNESGPHCGIVLVPKVQARLSAGGGSLEANGDPVGSYAFRSDWLIRKGQASSMVLMDVVGDSMAPAIEDGDMVLIDQSQTGVVPGAIYAVGVEGGVYVKRVDLLPGVLVLNSINPSYSAIEVPLRGDLADTVRVIGRVIWWCREAK